MFILLAIDAFQCDLDGLYHLHISDY